MVLKLSSLQKGLVAHYPLDAASLKSSVILGDKTPYENDGVSANTPNFVSDRFGHTRAMSFNGTTDYVNCGNAASLDITGEITVAFWHNPKYETIVGSTYYRGLVSKVSGYSGGYFVGIDYHVTPNAYMICGNSTLPAFYTIPQYDKWYFVVMTIDDVINRGNLYIDGELKTIHNNMTIGTNAYSVLLGRSATNRYTYGSIADVRIYNRALSPAEITALYEQYRPKLSLGSLMAGLVLDMPLQSRYMKSATVLTDRTPYSNDGVNSGATIGADYASFNGTSDNIRIADSESLSPTSAMSVMCWVKGAAHNTNLFSNYDYEINQRSFKIRGVNDKIGVIISDDGTLDVGHYKSYSSSVNTFNNAWHLIGFTFNAGTLKLYVDGVEDTNPTKETDGAITTIHNSTADVMIGCQLASDIPIHFFGGDIAKARMYNRVLTPAEWLLAFEKQKGAFL